MYLFRSLFLDLHSFLKWLLIGGGSVLAVLLAWEEFPLSTYPMYSKTFEPEVIKYWSVVGVSTDGSQEIIFPIRKVFWPLTQAAFLESLVSHYEAGGVSSMGQILSDLVPFYNERRDHLPEAGSLRLYRLYYDWNEYKSSVVNNKSSTQILMKPKKVELLWEYGWER